MMDPRSRPDRRIVRRTDEGVSDPDQTSSCQSEVLRDGEVLCGSVDVLDSGCDEAP